MLPNRHALLALVVISAVYGCGARGGDVLSENERAALCEPRATRECTGPGACPGAQQCGKDSHWGQCECGPNAGVGGSTIAGGVSSAGSGKGGAGALAAAGFPATQGGTGAVGSNPGGMGKGGASNSAASTSSTTGPSKGGTNAGGTTGSSKGGTATGGTTTTTGGVAFGGGTTIPQGGISYGGATSSTATGGLATGGTFATSVGGFAGGSGVGGATNQPPVITELAFSNSVIGTNDTLWVYPRATDPESNAVVFSYAWSCNGSQVGSDTNQLNGSMYFSKGDEIRVTVTPRDRTSTGVSVTSIAFIVENLAPVFESWPAVSPDSVVGDDVPLECTAAAYDLDDDTVTYSYHWYLNGVATLNTTSTLPASLTTIGDRWACEVTASDGGPNGTQTGISSDTRVVNQVSGIYRSDVTWQAAKSPYYLTDRLQIASGVTLTLEPGVTVFGYQQYLESWGNIVAVGTKEKPIFIRDLHLFDNSTSLSPGKATFAFVEYTNGQFFGGATNASLTVTDSILRYNWSGTNLATGVGSAHRFERNVFYNSCGIQTTAPLTLTNNAFWRDANYCFDIIVSDLLTAKHNSFYASPEYSVVLGAKSADLSNNYWGGLSDAEVPDRIRDNNDELGILGQAVYLPTLSSPHADTPPFDKIYAISP